MVAFGVTKLCVYFILCSAYFTVSQAFTAWIWGVHVEEIRFFYGRQLAVFVVRRVKLSIGWIPTGNWVRFQAEHDNLEESRSPTSNVGRRFHEAHPFVRAFIVLMGPFSLLVVASAFLTPRVVVADFVGTFGEVWSGGRHPFLTGADLIEQSLQFMDNSSFAVGLGKMGVKIAALNSFPIPICAGGFAIATLIKWKQSENQKYLKREVAVTLVGMLLVGALLVGWGAALAVFVTRRAGM